MRKPWGKMPTVKAFVHKDGKCYANTYDPHAILRTFGPDCADQFNIGLNYRGAQCSAYRVGRMNDVFSVGGGMMHLMSGVWYLVSGVWKCNSGSDMI